ncbi:hypothetical protein TVAG_038330 [Trichomonas vaginalis G3]|uniref:Chromo domain-containing protein n=1 Tax=Trichomonas vaginalis (strain ATCC PRA-98 / G3) TaxID=412133 RepID=A2DXZ1_TRIV3|nr:hypothetical protein TVAGG3_0960970 [Trichomonas vaginalis G3]EAY14727.1 hypothetical protein TVAG_038330 [Trichomonas vaginalis G3]KAI5487902.1 hypothetical protein TVAGG3_0960970 [Trichomonas vaginalis G3]|eukprot:XP_001326950.1 hypothetical protein [Trichomonas vaginalis G3]
MSGDDAGSEGNVKSIVDMRKIKRRVQFKVRWSEEEKILDENGNEMHRPDEWINYRDISANYTIIEFFNETADSEKYEIFKKLYPKSYVVKEIEKAYAGKAYNSNDESENSSDSPQFIQQVDEVINIDDSDSDESDDSPKILEATTIDAKKQKSKPSDDPVLITDKKKKKSRKVKDPILISHNSDNSSDKSDLEKDLKYIEELQKKTLQSRESPKKELQIPDNKITVLPIQVMKPVEKEEKPTPVNSNQKQPHPKRKKIQIGKSNAKLIEITCSPEENYNYEINDAEINVGEINNEDTTKPYLYQVRKIIDIINDSDEMWAILEVADEPEPKRVKLCYARYLWPDQVINYLMDQVLTKSDNNFTPDLQSNKKDELNLLIERELAK